MLVSAHLKHAGPRIVLLLWVSQPSLSQLRSRQKLWPPLPSTRKTNITILLYRQKRTSLLTIIFRDGAVWDCILYLEVFRKGKAQRKLSIMDIEFVSE